MAIKGLTDQQADFIKKYLRSVGLFNRKRDKEYNAQLIAEYKAVLDRIKACQTRIAQVDDPLLPKLMDAHVTTAKSIMGRDKERPDTPGAHAELDKVDELLDFARDLPAFKVRRADMTASVEASKKALIRQKSEISKLWDEAEALAENAAKRADGNLLRLATQRLDAIRELIRTGEAEQKLVADLFENPTGGDVATTAIETTAARATLDVEAAHFRALKKSAQKTFGARMPTGLTEIIDATDPIISDVSTDDPTAINAAAGQVKTKCEVFAVLAAKVGAERDKWISAKAAVDARMATLRNHTEADEATTIKPKIDIIQGDINLANSKAILHDYTGAVTGLDGVEAACSEVIKLADAYKKVNAILADRTARMTEVRSLSASTQVAVVAAIAAAEDKFKEATDALAEVPKNYVDAETFLDEVTPLIDLSKRLHFVDTQAMLYIPAIENKYNAFKNWQDGLNPPDTPLDPDLARMTQMHSDVVALYAATGESPAKLGQSLERCLAICAGAYGGLKTELDHRKTNALAYYDERTKHATRLAKFEGKPGEEAVKGYIARMKADLKQAEGAVSRKQYHVGAQLLKSSEGEEFAMIAQLTLAARFFPKYKAVKDGIDAINGRTDPEDPSNDIAPDPNRAKAASLITEAVKLRADAFSKGVSQRDWKTATALIDAAQVRVNEARKMIAAFKAVADETAKQGDTPDAGKAVEIFAAIRQTAAGYAGGDFGEKLTEADNAMVLVSAKDASAKTIADNLAAAIAQCEEVITLAGKKKAFDAAYPIASNKYKSDVRRADTPENNISEQRKQISSTLQSAKKAAAKEGGYDYDTALALCDQAMTAANSVVAMLDKRRVFKSLMDRVQAKLTKLEGPDYVAGCGNEIAQIKKVQQEYADAEKAFNLGKMEAVAKRGDALLAPLDKVAEAYKTFNTSGYEGAALRFFNEIKDLCPDLNDSQFPERAQTKAYYTNFKHEVARHSYRAAMATYSPIVWGNATCLLVAAAWDAYKPVKLSTRALIDQRKADAKSEDALTQATLKALEERFAAAEGWATNRFDYAKAKTLMEAITADANTLATQIAEYDAYKAQLALTDTEIAALEQTNDAGAVGPMIERVKGKRANAIALADGGDRPAGTTLLKEAEVEAKKAATDSVAVNAFTDETNKIATDSEAEDADLGALLDKAKAQISAMVKEMDGVALMPRLLALGDRVADARAGLAEDEVTAKTVLGEVPRQIVAIRIEAANLSQILREIETATGLLAPLMSGHAQAAYSAVEAQGLADRLSGARHQVRSDFSKKDEAIATLEEVLRAYHVLKTATDAQIPYVALRDQVHPLIEPMEKHESRFAIQKDLVDFRTKMNEAEEKANAKEHPAAMALLNEVKALQASAMLKAKMTSNEKPTEDEVRAILNAPGGDKAFDAIVNGLDARATREVLRVAITVRMGCTLEMMENQVFDADGNPTGGVVDADKDPDGTDRRGPNMKALFDACSKLPAADTLSNASLGGIVRVKTANTASDHHPGTKKMTMREREFDASFPYGVGLEHELEGVPESLAPKPGKEMRQFSWNTLHEVGHAVDDKLKFTARRGKELAGWDYGSKDVGPYAEVIAKKFKYDKDYVARLMLKDTNPPVPDNPDPGKIEPDVWERRRIEVSAWVENMFEGRQPWQTTSAAKACEIDGRCYHESMPGVWVSYPISERAKGVTGYQFRSPLEWFSELYAAYHSDRLADAHPAREWLDKLKSPEEV